MFISSNIQSCVCRDEVHPPNLDVNSRVVCFKVRNCWQNYELELINYQNRSKIIRGWDDLFGKVKEHINSVQAMKLSPYYKVSAFEKKYINLMNINFLVGVELLNKLIRVPGTDYWLIEKHSVVFFVTVVVGGKVYKSAKIGINFEKYGNII